MEDVVIDRGFWNGRRVFLTGHTGFKGAWMSLLLGAMGAKVHGFALEAEHDNGIFAVASVARDLSHEIGDVRDLLSLSDAVATAQPEIVLHMAAQPLVRLSYARPVETYATNVMGTVHVLEAIRHVTSVRAVVIVSSDKCYENTGQGAGYVETDRLGGADPYSNSKACTELVTESFRRSFLSAASSPAVASARAGNVIGGGDWAEDRLVPDAIRAFGAGRPLRLRNPHAVRPWQHVLDPVLGYLRLAQLLFTRGQEFAEGWNFGPNAASEVTVGAVVDGLTRLWGDGARWEQDGGKHPHEASYLRLDCAKARARLGWQPALALDDALSFSVDWYRQLGRGADMREVSLSQIDRVLNRSATATQA
jgi:CDP-glucose 4,6-dehydratase